MHVLSAETRKNRAISRPHISTPFSTSLHSFPYPLSFSLLIPYVSLYVFPYSFLYWFRYLFTHVLFLYLFLRYVFNPLPIGIYLFFPSFNRVSPKKGGGPNCDNRVPGTCKEKTRTNPEVQTTPSHLGTHSPYDSVVATYPHRGATYTRAAT